MADTECEEVGPQLKAISDSLMYESDDADVDDESGPFAFDNLFGGMENVIDSTAEPHDEALDGSQEAG